jgi:PAS domain S-box-containing protein
MLKLIERLSDGASTVLKAEVFLDSNPVGTALRHGISPRPRDAQTPEAEITQRKALEKVLDEQEKQLSDFFEDAAEGMHRLGPDGAILWANKAELAMLGFPAEEYIGRHISEFHTNHEVVDQIFCALRRGETVVNYPARLRCKDGSVRHVLLHSQGCFENEKLIQIRCMTRDVTDRVLLEQRLNESQEELARAERRKEEFLAMLGHELRNPLAPITTSLGLMRLQTNNKHTVNRSRQVIERQISLITRLVDDLLDISRITLGKITLRTETVQLESIVEQAIELTRPLLDKLGHQLNVDLPAQPVSLHGDPTRLSQALANLLDNAAQYTEEGGRILLSAHAAGNELVLSVKDNGSGLRPELCDRIFEPFIQGGNPLTHARGGLGVGLTLVRTIVELHGGQVQASSKGPGCGSEFIVRLPLQSLDK